MFEDAYNNNNHLPIMPIDFIAHAIKTLKAARIPYRTGSGFIAYDANGTGARMPLDYTNLNGKARDAHGKKIWCRHLAYFMINGPIDKSKLASLQSKESIEQIDILRENQFDKEKIEAKGKHYCIADADKFGETLFELSHQVDEGDYHNFLLATENHMMALSIIREDNYFIVKFFDPNRSRKYIKCVCLDKDSLKNITINVFLDEAHIKFYGIDSSPMIFISYHDGWDNKVSIKTENKAYLIYYFLEQGFADLLNTFLSKYATSLSIADWQAIVDESTGLDSALSQGHMMAVRIYLGHLLRCIYDACMNNNAILVKAYIDILLNSHLTADKKITLIRESLGGLQIAFKHHHLAIADVFISTILADQQLAMNFIIPLLNRYQHQPIPLAHILNGMHEAICSAFNDNHAISVGIYLNQLIHSHLSLEQKHLWLQRAIPYVIHAAVTGHTKMVNSFMTCVLAPEINTDSRFVLQLLVAARPYPLLWTQIKQSIVKCIQQQPTKSAQQDVAEMFRAAINLQRKPHALSQMRLFKTNTQKQVEALIEQSILPADSEPFSWTIGVA